MYTFDFNKLVGNIILVFGYLVFLFNLTYVTPFHTYNTVTNFYLTVIILCITIFCWIIWHLASRSFIINRFLWVLTVSGILLSFSILFILQSNVLGFDKTKSPKSSISISISSIADRTQLRIRP
mgnify:CR=1 FL=1